MKRLNDWKISKKIAFAFLVITIIAAIAGALVIYVLLTLKRSNETLYREDTLALQHAGVTGLNFQQIRYDAIKLSAIDLKDPAVRTPVTDEMKTLIVAVNDSFGNIEATVSDVGIKKRLNDLKSNWLTYKDALQLSIDSVKEGDATFLNQTKPANSKLGSALRDQFEQFYKALAEQAAKSNNANINIANTIIIVVAVIVGVMIVASFILGNRLSLGLSRPLVILAKYAGHLASGDLEVQEITAEKNKG